MHIISIYHHKVEIPHLVKDLALSSIYKKESKLYYKDR